ncbi:Wax ester synthase/acyl-CoA:diacylglycerol acyltransferase [Patulibacter medicamentivorans]|uniref:Diacylglycerol O-acyltransferase n=1 Tax=Patulibacter medicamentivorans TaxID=1097667 RepID=H0E8H9_9ACTN|nr:wax ester/triacylglycerol synthase family O-acyltransferase [Patulibacter medicamentivorans]EHN09979.1 Wax ester synthase/acyl-CoA:diacylglycerol acyltransferase [Patulibacter medicamentivorans]
MAHDHLAELTAADVALLREEHGGAHMHVGGIAVFRGELPPIEAVREHVRARLQRVPRYRTKLVTPPLGLGRPRWAVDPSFNLEYHVRHTALPCPGGEDELRTAAARLFSQRLDRTKPLWELWVVEGVDADRFAIVTKSHHALVDGVVAVDLMTTLLDAEPDPPPVAAHGGWLAPPLPSSAQLLMATVGDAGRQLVSAPLRVLQGLARPADAAGRVRGIAEAVGERVGVRAPAPSSPLNVPIGPHRRLSWTSVAISDLKRVKDTFGGSVNDVVLATVAGAIRHWMHERGLRTDDLELRAAVPVAVEGERSRGAGPGEPRPIALAYAPLPIGEPDALTRLERIRRATSEALAGKRAVTAQAMTASSESFSPPSVLAQASRLSFAPSRFNLLVTNIPGPQVPMYLMGRQMETMVPVPFLSGDRSLAIAVMSYGGRAEFGLLGDLDKLPDLDVLADGVQLALRELLECASEGRPGPRRRRSRSSG